MVFSRARGDRWRWLQSARCLVRLRSTGDGIATPIVANRYVQRSLYLNPPLARRKRLSGKGLRPRRGFAHGAPRSRAVAFVYA